MHAGTATAELVVVLPRVVVVEPVPVVVLPTVVVVDAAKRTLRVEVSRWAVAAPHALRAHAAAAMEQ